MKINGKVVTCPAPAEFYVKNGNEIFQFKAAVILDATPFRNLCPNPVPPMVTQVGKEPAPDPFDKEYLKAMDRQSQRYTDWLFITSISETEGLEWETVDIKDPETWENAVKDLEKVFPKATVQHIQMKVLEANAPSQDSEEEARKLFFESQEAEKENTSSQAEEQISTISGGHVNDSECSLPESLDLPGTIATGSSNNN